MFVDLKQYVTTFSGIKACLHIPAPSPSPSECPSKFNIVPMVTGSLTGRMGLEAILPVKLPVTIDTMLNFDGHSDGDGDGAGMCKQALSFDFEMNPVLNIFKQLVNLALAHNSRNRCAQNSFVETLSKMAKHIIIHQEKIRDTLPKTALFFVLCRLMEITLEIKFPALMMTIFSRVVKW